MIMMIKRAHRSICYTRLLLVIITMIITRGKTQLVIDDDSSELPSTNQGIMKAELFSGLDLKICCLELSRELNLQRNASGHIIAKNGINIEMLDWVATAYNFTYECVAFTPVFSPSTRANMSTLFGFFQMLDNNMCDLIGGPMIMMHNRFLLFDFLNPYNTVPVRMLIPKPTLSFSNLDAIWKPFQQNVWLVLLILVAMTTMVLALLHSIITRFKPSASSAPPVLKESFGNLIKLYGDFVFKKIANQGGGGGDHISSSSKSKIKIRFVLGAWCLVCFVLITAYSSVLTSFIMAPHYKLFISSLRELVENEEANPVIVQNVGIVGFIQEFTDPLMTKLVQKIDERQENRCYNTTTCLELVKSGTNVFIEGELQLILAMSKDLEKTGKCNVALLPNNYLFNFRTAWGIRWNDPRKEMLNRGMLRMIDSGMVDGWYRRTAPSGRCVKEGINPPKSRLTRLTLPNLQGPFAILIVGCVLATLAWFGELLFAYYSRKN